METQHNHKMIHIFIYRYGLLIIYVNLTVLITIAMEQINLITYHLKMIMMTLGYTTFVAE